MAQAEARSDGDSENGSRNAGGRRASLIVMATGLGRTQIDSERPSLFVFPHRPGSATSNKATGQSESHPPQLAGGVTRAAANTQPIRSATLPQQQRRHPGEPCSKQDSTAQRTGILARSAPRW